MTGTNPNSPHGPVAEKKPDGSSLPPGFLPVLTEELYSQRFAKMQLPGSSKRRPGARSRAQHGKQQGQQTLEDGDDGSADDEPGSGGQYCFGSQAAEHHFHEGALCG